MCVCVCVCHTCVLMMDGGEGKGLVRMDGGVGEEPYPRVAGCGAPGRQKPPPAAAMAADCRRREIGREGGEGGEG